MIYKTRIFLFALRVVFEVMLFRLRRRRMVVLYFEAIPERVSPFLTMWYFLVGFTEEDTLIMVPAFRVFLLEKAFSSLNRLTVVLYFNAMPDRVSPFLTVWYPLKISFFGFVPDLNINFVPVLRVVFDVMLFRLRRRWTVELYFKAIPDRVSPFFTVW